MSEVIFKASITCKCSFVAACSEFCTGTSRIALTCAGGNNRICENLCLYMQMLYMYVLSYKRTLLCFTLCLLLCRHINNSCCIARFYKITELPQALLLVVKCVQMRVCKHDCDVLVVCILILRISFKSKSGLSLCLHERGLGQFWKALQTLNQSWVCIADSSSSNPPCVQMRYSIVLNLKTI